MTSEEPAAGNRERLNRGDWRFLAMSIVLACACVAIVARYFSSAFPEASIDFRYDRSSSRPIAEKLLAAQRVDVRAMKHAVAFDSDGQARIFLERSLGLDQAQAVLRHDVRIWVWHHRWFRPLVEEELSVDVAPTGEIVGFTHKLPEDHAGRVSGPSDTRPETFLKSIGVLPDGLTLVSTSERRLPKRTQRIYTYESKRIRPAGATYRHTVTIDGEIVSGYSQHLKVPDAWLRSYNELRSKNSAAGLVDWIFMAATMIGAVVMFIVHLRRGDLSLRFLLAIGGASLLLVGGVVLNSLPSQLAGYDTTTSYPAFVGWLLFSAAVESLGTAMMLIVICGAGEVLYRQRLPQHLAIPRLWTPKALKSKRVFRSLVLGYALVPAFIAYQVGFYLVAQRFGAWSPAEVPYDDMLNTALPWVAVLFAGFLPAFSEEFLSRAFSIPFLQRFVRSRLFAIVLAAFIWGFGHSTYPNQPFWIRGVEVGVAGIVAGLLMDRFGLLPLLIWHYTIDAVYTATLLFASGNTYYVVSAALSSLIFAVPLVVSIALYLRNRGFVPDDDLTNATMPMQPPPPSEEAAEAVALPDPIHITPARAIACVVTVILAAAAIAFRPESPDDVIDYRITKEQAKAVARAHLAHIAAPSPAPSYQRVIALPVPGFRSWDRDSGREDGGKPADYFDSIAATHLVQHGVSVHQLNAVFRDRIEAGTWMIRFFTPRQKEEIFVEVDPRRTRVIGYHKYQDEARPGPSLTKDAALTLAKAAFAAYGLTATAFDLKEALTFAQPGRRDWLFHFDERAALAPQAFRRITVRVAGNEVTQFNKTIRIPESVYREASTSTLFNVLLIVLKIIGAIALVAIVVAGLVIAGRKSGLPWRRPLRWTLALAWIPLLAIAAGYESTLFGYSTTVAWDTFRVTQITSFVFKAGLQIGVLFLALAGLEAAVSYAPGLIRAEGRARFGKSAVVAAVTAIAILVIADIGARFVAQALPSAAVVEISVPGEVAIPFPALVETGRGLIGAIVFSGLVALYAFALRRHAALITIVAVFFAVLDPTVTMAQAPAMVARALVLAALVWIVSRWVLSSNPLAWPMFAFLGATLQTASVLLTNHRPDLLANGVGAIVIVVAAVVWAWLGRTDARVV